MSDETIPEVHISTRPFLGDMLAQTTQTRSASGSPAENAHLFAAATGRAHLHRVSEDERPTSPAPTSAVLPENYQMPTQPPTRRNPSVAPMAVVESLLDDVDWNAVDTLTKQLTLNEDGAGRTRAEFDVATASASPETPFEEQALSEITRLVTRHAEWRVVNLGSDNEWSPRKRAQHVQAVFDNAFRYGRLQQYLREPDVEDVSIVGHDNVMVTKSTGRREQRPPLTDHASDLEQMISDIASWRGRSFSRPGGHLDLDIGGARLSATGVPITSVPNLTIRKHNLVDVDLDDMVNIGTITEKMRTFLTLASRANCSALIGGFPGTGKTTFLRAWMATVPWDEKIVTIETERELYLNKGTRHAQVQDLQYMPAMFSGTDVTASYSLSDAFYESLRSSAQRILYGEMRGPESGWAMKAMQAGRGSISTIHARSADDAIHRFADMLMSEYGLAADTVPLRQILRSIDIIIYLDFIENSDGTRTRIVSEIAEVRANDRLEPMASKLFQWDWDKGIYTEPEKPSEDKLRPMLERASRTSGSSVMLLGVIISFLLNIFGGIQMLRSLCADVGRPVAGDRTRLSPLYPMFPGGQMTDLERWLTVTWGDLNLYGDVLRQTRSTYYFQSGDDQFSAPYALRSVAVILGSLRWGLPVGSSPVATLPGLFRMEESLFAARSWIDENMLKLSPLPSAVPVTEEEFARQRDSLRDRAHAATANVDPLVHEFDELCRAAAELLSPTRSDDSAERAETNEMYRRYVAWLPFGHYTAAFDAALARDLDYQPKRLRETVRPFDDFGVAQHVPLG